jgi:hypothetical protein
VTDTDQGGGRGQHLTRSRVPIPMPPPEHSPDWQGRHFRVDLSVLEARMCPADKKVPRRYLYKKDYSVSGTAAINSSDNRNPTKPVGGVLTPQTERLIRIGSIGSAVIIAISAMVLSYSGLLDLALDADISPRLALLVPIMVDGLQFVGSLGVVYSTLCGLRSWYPWLLMLMGVSVSSWGNWQAAPDDLTSKLLHASAPIILALVLEELLRVMRHKVQAHSDAIENEEAAAAAEQTTATAHAEIALADPVQQDSPPLIEGLTAGATPTAEAIAPESPDSFAGELAREVAPEPAAPLAVPVTEPAEPVVEVPVVEVPVETLAPEPVTETLAPEPVTETLVPEPAAQPVAPTTESDSPTTATPDVQAMDKNASSDSTNSETDWLPEFPVEAPFKEQVKAILVAAPDVRPAHIARALGKDPSHTRKIVRDVRAEIESVPAQQSHGATATEHVTDRALDPFATVG